MKNLSWVRKGMANYTEANQNKLIKKRQIRKLNIFGPIGKQLWVGMGVWKKKNVVRKRVGRCQSINEGPTKSILLSLHLCPALLATRLLNQTMVKLTTTAKWGRYILEEEASYLYNVLTTINRGVKSLSVNLVPAI